MTTVHFGETVLCWLKTNVVGLAVVAVAVTSVPLAVGCSSVDAIGLHDNNVPIQSRRLCADAQDAVSIARARLDDAERNLEEIEEWERSVVSDSGWPKDGSAAANLDKLGEARLRLANTELEHAEASLDLALAKLDLVHAQTAIRHDLDTYDLVPLKERTDEALKRVQGLVADIERQRGELEKITAQWWGSYSSYVKGGGKSAEYFTSFEKVEFKKKELRKAEPKSDKKGDDGPKESDGKAPLPLPKKKGDDKKDDAKEGGDDSAPPAGDDAEGDE